MTPYAFVMCFYYIEFFHLKLNKNNKIINFEGKDSFFSNASQKYSQEN